ncbi:MAG: D-Ala-D-Ala carboxypeptidase family metallohydrolase [Candidatus Edwardsbacteria bacterium]
MRSKKNLETEGRRNSRTKATELHRTTWKILMVFKEKSVKICGNLWLNILVLSFFSGVFAKNEYFYRINQEWHSSEVFTYCVLPGQKVEIEIINLPSDKEMLKQMKDRRVAYHKENRATEEISFLPIEWTAPQEPGLYPLGALDFLPQNTNLTSRRLLNIIVMIPPEKVKNGRLNGFLIGHYPKNKMPLGFIEVTEENKDTYISEHFQLKDFLCPQNSGFPQYLVLDMKLVEKLEILIKKLNSEGYPCSKFAILSGYRTPYYNRSRPGRARESRHMYGEAADIFVDDLPKDGMMDDLNGDGQVNMKDAEIIAKATKELNDLGILPGGYAAYPATKQHGPFVQVDTRGYSVTWRTTRRKTYSHLKGKRK